MRYLKLIYGFFVCINLYAKTVPLHELPQDSSKLIASLKTHDILIPIYYPSYGEWLKVFIPYSGEVGWVKIYDLNGNGKSTVNEEINIKQQFSIVKHKNKSEVLKLMTYTYNISQNISVDLIKEILIKRHEIAETRIQKITKFLGRMNNYIDDDLQLNNRKNLTSSSKEKNINQFELESSLFESFPHLPLTIIIPESDLLASEENVSLNR